MNCNRTCWKKRGEWARQRVARRTDARRSAATAHCEQDDPPPLPLPHTGLEGLKYTLFKLCKANARVLETKPGKYGCGERGWGKGTRRGGHARPSNALPPHTTNRAGTYMYYRFGTNAELRKFQDCQSAQKLFIDQVLNKGYKTPLTNPPSEWSERMGRRAGA